MKKYINLIRKLAWSFHKTTGIDWDDLFGEACLAYCEACLSYRANHNKLSVWIYICIKNRLINYCHKEERLVLLDEETEEYYDNQLSTDPAAFFELFDSLSDDSKEISQMVLDDPTFFLGVRGLGRVAKSLRKKQWSFPRIETGIRNMKLELKEVG